MKNSKNKKNYFIIIFRPLIALKLSLTHFYGRIVLKMSVFGINLPGFKKIKNNISLNALSAYERTLIIYKIKGERYTIQFGPIWFRRIFENFYQLYLKNKFWLKIAGKTTVAFFIIIIPILIFIIIRCIFPVPERIPFNNITTHLSKNSNFKVDWLYTESPFTEKDINNSTYHYLNENNERGVYNTPVLEKNSPAGLSHFGIGYYPYKLNFVRGFIVGDEKPITIQKNRNVDIEIEEGNRLRIQYYLLPSFDGKTYQCQLDIKDQNGKLLTSFIKSTPKRLPNRDPNSIKAGLYERFVPNSYPDGGQIDEFIINLKFPPEKIIASSLEISDKNNSNITSKKNNIYYNSNDSLAKDKSIDVTNNNCVFVLGDFSFEHVVLNPPKRRGMIFIVVDALKADIAYNKDIMPNINRFSENNSIKFIQHRSQSNMTVPSIFSLMTSLYIREIGSISLSYGASDEMRKEFNNKNIPLMATEIQKLGYRVGAIGMVSFLTEALKGGADLGFHNAIISEAEQYETRQTTEHLGSWLEMYGDAPFFLYVHYNTTHGPFRPPFEKLDVAQFLSSPLGVNYRKELYKGTARFFDDEFANILKKLKDLNIQDEVDIVFTSDHGIQMDYKPWYYLKGIENNTFGSYADKGHSLFDEEVKVPFIFHLAQKDVVSDKIVTEPTAHLDIFPTIYHLLGGIETNNNWKGINFSESIFKINNKNFSTILSQRDKLFFESFDYMGMLYWGESFKTNPIKYIKQLSRDEVKLLTSNSIFRKKLSWFQPEIFEEINFNKQTDNILPNISSNNLKKIRKEYYQNSPYSSKVIIEPHYNGLFEMKFKIKNPNNFIENFEQNHPNTIKFSQNEFNNYSELNFKGFIKNGESISFNLHKLIIEDISLMKDISAIMCSNGNKIELSEVSNILNNNLCAFFPPPNSIVNLNYIENEKPIVIKKLISAEKSVTLSTIHAGETLQNALKNWGYAK